MTHATRRLASVGLVSLALTLVVVGCNGAVGSTAPSAAGPTSALPTASLVPTAAPSPNPSTSAAATASPSSAIACAPLPATLALPTDRVTSVKITPGATSDSYTLMQ